MVRKLLMYVTNRIPEDDRDSFVNKRVDTPGIMLGNLFRQSFTRLIKDATTILNREISAGAWKLTNNFHNIVTNNNIYKILKSNIIETNMKYSLATGNWGEECNSKNRCCTSSSALILFGNFVTFATN